MGRTAEEKKNKVVNLGMLFLRGNISEEEPATRVLGNDILYTFHNKKNKSAHQHHIIITLMDLDVIWMEAFNTNSQPKIGHKHRTAR